MNRRDRSAIIFVTIMTIFLIGLRTSNNYLDDYEEIHNYPRQTSPVSSNYVTEYEYDSPSVSQQVLDILDTENDPLLPLVYSNLLDIQVFTNSTLKDDEYIPYLWHVHRSAGETMKQLMGECLGLTIASSFSFPIDNLMMTQDSVRIIRFNGAKYFNVNLRTQTGIDRAKNLGIKSQVETDLGPMVVDALISPNIQAVINTLLSENEEAKYQNRVKGVMFMMSRNPIEREISHFYHIKSTTLRPDVASYSLSDWFENPSYIDNSMVRQLTNKMDPAEEVDMDDLLVAKEILKRKCIIGLFEEKQESWERFQDIFKSRWSLEKRQTDEVCEDKLLNWGWKNRNKISSFIDITLEDNSQIQDDTIVDRRTFQQIASLNHLDMLLYEYTKYLFLEQRKIFHKPKKSLSLIQNATALNETSSDLDEDSKDNQTSSEI
jgi:hypothetical protein